ncbi:DUF397 domain-containing protein [Actinoplanes sp. NPDC049316]|uniref:DUF397 domain-containing protein n=1 Tax=Actinoplanes sp. NPDC049316 TaxID=3154727 RepID=UPI00342DA557
MSLSKFANWFKSSYSDGASNCVEVAFADDRTVGLRDSKDREGPVLEFNRGEWTAFIKGVQSGEFER